MTGLKDNQAIRAMACGCGENQGIGLDFGLSYKERNNMKYEN
jgi:hypothetical protein